jgi:DNA-binding LacI/PurR family transcriptional regulator
MAVAGLGAAQRMGVRVPADLSILVWDDSTLCELVHPAFTALRRDIPAAGVNAARMLRQAVTGERPDHLREALPVLLVRDSTAAAPDGRRP